jgi:hypothetical protein
VPRRFVRVAEIPVNAMGEIDRRRLADMLRPQTN